MTGFPRVALLALLAACGPASGPPDAQREMDGGTEAPAPVADAEVRPEAGTGAAVQFGLHAAGQAAALPASVAGTSVVSAILALHELTVASDNGAMKMEGLGALDLSTGMVTLTLSSARPGLYSRVVITFEPPDDGRPVPPAFGGLRLSARVTGTLASGAPFAINNGTEFGIDLVAPAPFDLQPGGRLLARVRFDLTQWFAGISFPAGAGPVLVDGMHSPELLTRFRSNLVGSATLTFE
jgi:hypothetical protein